MGIGLKDKQYTYYGSTKGYYSGLAVGSTAAWAFVDFSGTTTGFGTASNELSNRISIVSSGTSYVEWALGSAATMPQAGEIWAGNGFTQDGVHVSGVWVRSDTASQAIQMWAW